MIFLNFNFYWLKTENFVPRFTAGRSEQQQQVSTQTGVHNCHPLAATSLGYQPPEQTGPRTGGGGGEEAGQHGGAGQGEDAEDHPDAAEEDTEGVHLGQCGQETNRGDQKR